MGHHNCFGWLYSKVTNLIVRRHNKNKKKKMQQQAAAQEETLTLMVEGKDVPKRRLSLRMYQGLNVMEGNTVIGFVHGKPCKILLDSGAGVTVMFFPLAKKLGLVTGHEIKVKMTIHMWSGIEEVSVIQLPRVVITLEGGVKVTTPVQVFPAKLERSYEPDVLTLDVRHLQRGGVLQTFSPKASNMFFRHPQRLRENPGKQGGGVLQPFRPKASTMFGRRAQSGYHCSGKHVQKFCVRREGSEKPLTVLLDTGANAFCVSESLLRKMMQESGSSKAPHRVVLDLGAGKGQLVAEKLRTLPSDTHDFVMGV